MTEFRRIMSSRTADRIVRIAVIVSVLVSGFSAWRWQDLTACVARYNDSNNQRSVILTQATDDERRAERTADDAQAALFVSPILSKSVDERTPAERAQLLQLFRAYQKALTEQANERTEADNARKQHPVPDPPKDVCG